MKIIILGRCPNWNNILNKASFHWTKRKKIFDEWAELTYWALYQTENKPVFPYKNPVDLVVCIEYKDKRIRDTDGVTIKPILDSLVKSGVFVDDNNKHIKTIKTEVVSGCNEDKVTLEIIERTNGEI